MKKAVISVLVGTAVLAFVACGKNAATENSSDSGVSTVSASSQVENGQKATRVNQGTNLSPGSPKNIPSGGGEQLRQDTSFGDASFGDTSFRRAS